MPNKPTTLRESTTIQTIKEAEERFDTKFDSRFYGKPKEVQMNVEDVKSHITQTLLAVFESELEEIGDVGGEFTGFENNIEWGTKIGRSLERQKLRSHLTEVINYLKQK